MVFLLGFTATVSQILVLRELLIVFEGNELSTGFLLTFWSFFTAAGSWLAADRGFFDPAIACGLARPGC